MRSADSHSTKKIVRNHRCKRSFSSKSTSEIGDSDNLEKRQINCFKGDFFLISHLIVSGPATPAPATRSARQKSAAAFDMEALNRTAAEIKNHLDNNNRKSSKVFFGCHFGLEPISLTTLNRQRFAGPRHRELSKTPEKKPYVVEPLKKVAEPAKTSSKGGTEHEKIKAGQSKTNQVKSAVNKDPAKVTPVKIRRHSETVMKKVSKFAYPCELRLTTFIKVETENHGNRPRSATKTISDYKSRRKSEFKLAYIDKRHGHSSMGNVTENRTPH